MEIWHSRKEGIEMKYMKIEIDDDSLFGIIAAANEALQTVVSALAEDKGDSGSVTIKINMEKNTFKDGYKKLQNGLNIAYKVDSAVTSKTSFNETIPTDNLMLAAYNEYGYVLTPAPDPQMSITDLYEEEED